MQVYITFVFQKIAKVNNKIKHVFFDLDRTLWDFEKSAAQAFDEIYKIHGLKDKGVISATEFHNAYTIHNNKLWDQYRNGEIKKEVLRGLRFKLTLGDFGINDDILGEKIGDDYVRLSPLLVNLFPYAIEILEYLYPKYKLHIITNGFAEVQAVKLSESGMRRFFDQIITSEEAGVKKPDSKIFNFAFDKSGAKPINSIMIGDDYEVDIIGAKEVGMDQIFFDPYSLQPNLDCNYRVVSLNEIFEIL